MKRLALAIGLLVLFFAPSGCKKQPSDKDAIRAGIMQHLTSVGGLNMSNMDMDIRSVSITGNQAHAEVEFRPKNSGPQGASMEVAYNLEKRDGSWVVQKTQPLAGGMQHPDPSQNPPPNPNVHPGSLPNFNDILTPASPPKGALPPGHPTTNPQQQASSPSAGQPPNKNP